MGVTSSKRTFVKQTLNSAIQRWTSVPGATKGNGKTPSLEALMKITVAPDKGRDALILKVALRCKEENIFVVLVNPKQKVDSSWVQDREVVRTKRIDVGLAYVVTPHHYDLLTKKSGDYDVHG